MWFDASAPHGGFVMIPLRTYTLVFGFKNTHIYTLEEPHPHCQTLTHSTIHHHHHHQAIMTSTTTTTIAPNSVPPATNTHIHKDTDLAPTLPQAPPLDLAWLVHEREANLTAPKPAIEPIARQPIYAADCRRRNAAMLAPGARDHHLAHGIVTREITVPSRRDGFAIPVLQYDRVEEEDEEDGKTTAATTTSSSSPSSLPKINSSNTEEGENNSSNNNSKEPQTIIIYYHGGGLLVGETDSEDLSCRRLVKDSASFLSGRVRLYSIGYRLKPQHKASVCVADSIDAFDYLAARHQRQHPRQPRIVVAGSSSGGELAAFVTQHALLAVAAKHTTGEAHVTPLPFHGVLLRCPVTSDAFRGAEYVPAPLREMHTSARHPSFSTSLLPRLDMDGPRDGLERMPLEVDESALKGMPRTWIQVCTNDGLYSDGACYAKVLRDAGCQVKTDVVWGWPHTFWLKAPQLERALEAEMAMLEGLKWVVSAEESI